MERELIQQEQLVEFHPKTSICFISKSKVVNVPFNEITHISKYGNEVVLYTQTEQYRTKHSLQELLNDLPINDFFKIHRSHIVSLKHMNGVKRKRVKVREYHLPISKYYKVQLCANLAMLLNRDYHFYEKS